MGYLLLPIAVVFLFSFNAPAGRFSYTWEEFTLSNWAGWNDVPGLEDGLVTSLALAALASLAATALGTLIALRSPVTSSAAAGRSTSSSSCRCRRRRSSSAPPS